MKKTITIGLVAVGLVASTLGYAEYKHVRGGHEDKKVEWQQHEDRKIEHLKAELNLTPDQEAKIRTAFQGMHEKVQALREETHKNVASLLTPEQRIKFEQLKEKKHER